MKNKLLFLTVCLLVALPLFAETAPESAQPDRSALIKSMALEEFTDDPAMNVETRIAIEEIQSTWIQTDGNAASNGDVFTPVFRSTDSVANDSTIVAKSKRKAHVKAI